MLRWTGGLAFAFAAIVVGWLVMTRPWSGNAEPPADRKPPRDAFAPDKNPKPVQVVPFDAKRALSYLQQICKIGPRISGTEGMKKQQELLRKHFESHGGQVTLQKFTAKQRSQRNPVEMANLIVSWHPDRERRVILCSHYDTRPIADQEPDPRHWTAPFLSANDGGSGVALLMELAHHLKKLPAEVGVDFVCFDGEEYIFDPGPGRDKYFFGSEHFAEQYRKARPKRRYVAAVLLDMIAGKEARFPIEQNSWLHAASLVEELWKIAAEQKCDAFQKEFSTGRLDDDHLALNAVGIPAVDIVPNLEDYAHWHRLSDVPENCSGDTLAQVARVLTVWLQRVK